MRLKYHKEPINAKSTPIHWSSLRVSLIWFHTFAALIIIFADKSYMLINPMIVVNRYTFVLYLHIIIPIKEMTRITTVREIAVIRQEPCFLPDFINGNR